MSEPKVQITLTLNTWRAIAAMMRRASRWDVGESFDVEPGDTADEIERQVWESLNTVDS